MPNSSPTKADARWQAARDEHRVALASFVDTAEHLSAQAWSSPRAEGKWTPAQIADHLALSYEALLRELRGGGHMSLKLTPARRTLLRWLLLPHMLFHRSFPRGARAPREVRPGEGSPDRAGALHRLQRLGEEFERELCRARRAGAGELTHPYFGRVGPLKVLRFCAVHIEHHQKQLAAL